VFLAINIPALAVQFTLQTDALAWSEMAVRSGKSLVYSDPRKTRFNLSGLTSGQLATADALIDPLLFTMLATVDTTRARKRDCGRSKKKSCDKQEVQYNPHSFTSKNRGIRQTLNKTKQEI